MNCKLVYSIAVVYLLIACSKNSSKNSTPVTPAAACGTTANCVLGNWFIYSTKARLKNGSPIPLYTTGSSNNLVDYAFWNWIFTAEGKWTEYIHGGIFKDSGRYVVNKDTLFTKGKYPHAFFINFVNNTSMLGYFIFDHAKPDSLLAAIPISLGIDTANFNGLELEWQR
jgi:hypothetical protein